VEYVKLAGPTLLSGCIIKLGAAARRQQRLASPLVLLHPCNMSLLDRPRDLLVPRAASCWHTAGWAWHTLSRVISLENVPTAWHAACSLGS
jgi:hypothetical protein